MKFIEMNEEVTVNIAHIVSIIEVINADDDVTKAHIVFNLSSGETYSWFFDVPEGLNPKFFLSSRKTELLRQLNLDSWRTVSQHSVMNPYEAQYGEY